MKTYKAIWNGMEIELNGDDYNIAMEHVEYMRQSSVNMNIEQGLTEGEEAYFDPCDWKLSATLEEAMVEGKNEADGKTHRELDIIIMGLRTIAKDLDILGNEPCEDDDADDVFSITN